MKRLLCFIALITMVLFSTPIQLFGDTLDVAAIPPGNVNNVINGDTLAGGFRAHPDRVYRLQRGFVYQVAEAMNINGSLHIVATDGPGRPPVLAPQILQDNSSIDHFFTFIGPDAEVELKDLYILAARADGNVIGWGEAIRINADHIKMTLKGDVFDAFQHTALMGHGQWSKLDVQDCVFRNEMHPSSWFGGGALLTDGNVHMDTCLFINNSIFCNNSYNWSIRGYCPYALFEHNTMVYAVVNPFLIRQAENIHINNNLFFDAHAMGGNPTHVIDGWFLNYPDTASSSIIRFRGTDSVSYWSKLWAGTIAGPEVYEDANNGVTAEMVSASNRVIDVRNNSYFWSQKLWDFYNAYNDTVQIYDSIPVPVYGEGENNGVKAYVKRTLVKPTWMSKYTLYTLDTLLAGVANITVSGNVEEDPGFDADILDQENNLIDYVHKISTDALDSSWYYHTSASLYPFGGPVWPLAENLAYTNANLMHAGTDGFALGDLNWFPDQKAEWEIPTGVNDVDLAPTQFALNQNYPNPFNPSTKITFALGKAGYTTLNVYNVLGQKVATLVSGNLQAGTHEVNFNAANLSTGVYIYRLESNNNIAIKKMILLK